LLLVRRILVLYLIYINVHHILQQTYVFHGSHSNFYIIMFLSQKCLGYLQITYTNYLFAAGWKLFFLENSFHKVIVGLGYIHLHIVIMHTFYLIVAITKWFKQFIIVSYTVSAIICCFENRSGFIKIDNYTIQKMWKCLIHMIFLSNA